MENRFGVKDFFLFLLLGALIVLVILAMRQYDRQWDTMRLISASLEEQSATLREIRNTLQRGVPTIGGGAVPGPGDPSLTRHENTAFGRLAKVHANEDFAMGDRVVDAFGGGVAKLTPLLSGDAAASTVQGYVIESLCERDPETLEWLGLLATDWDVTDQSEAYHAFVAQQEQMGLSAEQIADHPDLPAPLIIDFSSLRAFTRVRAASRLGDARLAQRHHRREGSETTLAPARAGEHGRGRRDTSEVQRADRIPASAHRC